MITLNLAACKSSASCFVKRHAILTLLYAFQQKQFDSYQSAGLILRQVSCVAWSDLGLAQVAIFAEDGYRL